VCVKVSADPDILSFDIVKNTLLNIHPIVDPLDLQVLEEGLRIREQQGGEVIVVSAAPDTEEALVRSALLSGADRAIRVWIDALKGADTFLVSQVLKEAIEKVGFDLILCGARSSDQGSECMAASLGHLLNLPLATQIISLECGNRSLTVYKKLERGERETYTISLPAILALEQGINEPRYVAPFSRTYREGMKKEVEFFKPALHQITATPYLSTIRYTPPRPRVKVGIDIDRLSMEERLKMMRGELGSKKEIFEGEPRLAAQKIATKLFELIK